MEDVLWIICQSLSRTELKHDAKRSSDGSKFKDLSFWDDLEFELDSQVDWMGHRVSAIIHWICSTRGSPHNNSFLWICENRCCVPYAIMQPSIRNCIQDWALLEKSFDPKKASAPATGHLIQFIMKFTDRIKHTSFRAILLWGPNGNFRIIITTFDSNWWLPA